MSDKLFDKEILDSLEIIKDYCISHYKSIKTQWYEHNPEGCYECIFKGRVSSFDIGCLIADIEPQCWDLSKLKEKEELVNSLKLIQDKCRKHKSNNKQYNCPECELYNVFREKCGLNDCAADEYILNKSKDAIYRYFI